MDNECGYGHLGTHPLGMGKYPKVFAHKNMGSNTGNFYKLGYGEGK